jgi:hypothetical protein
VFASFGAASSQFRAVKVQSLLPHSTVDQTECNLQFRLTVAAPFNVKAPLCWTPDFKKKHRGHIADVCSLMNKHLAAWQAASAQSVSSKRQAANAVDLIVFPELSVQADDIDCLQRLSRETRASIFAGLCFQERSTVPSLIKPYGFYIPKNVPMLSYGRGRSM